MNKTLLLITTLLIAFLSCKKTDQKAPDTLIEEARNYFETSIKTNSSNSSPTGARLKIPLPEKKADWDRANVQDLRFGKTVVVPLSIPNFKTRDRLKTELQVEQNAFLIVYKDEEGKQHAEVVIKIPDENSEEHRFSGIVIVSDWQDNVIQSYKYTYQTETKMNTTILVRQNNASPETIVTWCIAIDWIVCAQMTGYPVYCNYNYSTYFCFTENSSTPGGGSTTPPPGSCCGSYGTISGGNNTYPLAKEIQLIKFDTSIKLINVPNCVYNIFHSLREQRSGFWGKIIYDMSGELPNFKWQLKAANITGQRTATTSGDDYGIYTTFNTTYLPDATNMSVARTMLHEAAHAFLIKKLPNTNKDYPQLYEEYNQSKNVNASQHQEMARSFVNDIAYCLKAYGQGLGIKAYDTYYTDMAWGGLQGTTYFNALPAADKERIQAIYEAELTGQTITLPNGVKISPLGTRTCNQ